MSEQLYVCPCCSTPGFTAAGLHRHQCRAQPERAKLTLVEIAAAPVMVTRTQATAAAAKEKGASP